MDFEYAWDFGETSELKAQVAEFTPKVEKLTNALANETRMRQYYVNRLVELKSKGELTLFQIIKRDVLDILNHLR